MKVLINIFLCGFLVLLMAGCAAEDGDLTPPDAAVDPGVIVSPTTSTTVVFTGTMASDAFISADALAPASAVITARDNVAGTWECTVSGMTHGSNTIWVYATDPVANTRTMRIIIVVDTVGPVVTVLQYPEAAQAGSFSFAGTVDEAGSTVSVEVYDSSAIPVLVASGPAFVDADIWDVDLNLGALSDGDYTVIATGTDRLGNDSATPAEQIINLAVANPEFAINNPTPLPIILADPTNETQVFFDGTILSGASLAVTTTSGLVGPVNLPILAEWNVNVSSLAAGNTVVTFDVVDGVTNTIQKVLVVRDQTPPTVVEWTSTTTSTVTVEFNESMDFATIGPENLQVIDSNETAFNVISVTQNSDRIYIFTTDLLTAGEYTATLQTTDTCAKNVVDGCYVKDARGNGIVASYVWRFNK